MRKCLLVLLLGASLVVLVGCDGGSSGSGTSPAPAPKADYDVAVSVEPSSVTVSRSDPGDVELVFTITNDGAKSDTYGLEFQVFGLPWVPEGVPTALDVPAGESKDLTVPFTFDVGGTAPGFDVVLTATSQGGANVSGQAACQVSFE